MILLQMTVYYIKKKKNIHRLTFSGTVVFLSPHPYLHWHIWSHILDLVWRPWTHTCFIHGDPTADGPGPDSRRNVTDQVLPLETLAEQSREGCTAGAGRAAGTPPRLYSVLKLTGHLYKICAPNEYWPQQSKLFAKSTGWQELEGLFSRDTLDAAQSKQLDMFCATKKWRGFFFLFCLTCCFIWDTVSNLGKWTEGTAVKIEDTVAENTCFCNYRYSNLTYCNLSLELLSTPPNSYDRAYILVYYNYFHCAPGI